MGSSHAVAVAAPQPETKAAAKADPAVARKVGKLLADFHAARKDLEQRGKLVDEAIALGPAAVYALHAAIGREMYPQLKGYSSRFYQRAGVVAKKKVGGVDPAEVQQLRETVLSLQNRPDFSKEQIVKVADPALKRLEEIFVVDREAVLDQADGLLAERKQLGELGGLWEKCAAFLYDQLPNDENRPKDRPSFEQYLRGEESLAAALAAPMDPQTRETLAVNARLATKLEPEEARAILALNLTRNLLGLSAVLIDPQLCAAARDHSHDMRTLKFFSHESPVPGKKSFTDRAKLFGTSASAENIAAGYHDGKAANQGWFHSPGHHKNMLDKHKRVGMGQSGSHYTEMFGG